MRRQTASQRRQVRERLREDSRRIQAHASELAQPGSAVFAEQVEQMNQAFGDEVTHTREATMDLANLASLSASVAQQAQAVRRDAEQFSFAALRDSLRAKGRDAAEGFRWDQLGNAAGVCFRAAPRARFLYGVLPAAAPAGGESQALRERRAKQQERAKALAEARAAREEDARVESTQLASVEQRKRALDAATLRMGRLNRLVKRQCPGWAPSSEGRESQTAASARGRKEMSAMDLVLNPDSFTQTVENTFDLSFLVTNGYASLDMQDEPADVIAAPAEPVDGDEARNMRKRQAIVTLTPDMVPRLASLLKRDEPIVPHRGPRGVEPQSDDDLEEFGQLVGDEEDQ